MIRYGRFQPAVMSFALLTRIRILMKWSSHRPGDAPFSVLVVQPLLRNAVLPLKIVS